VRTDGADRVEDPWEQLSGTPVPGADPDADDGLEAALLAYKQREAARWGAERFAAEFRRRDEAEEERPVWTSDALAPPVEASVAAQVVDGEAMTFRPEPPRIGFDPMFVVASPPPPIEDVIREPEEPSTERTNEEVVPGKAEDPAIEPAAFVPDAAWSAGSKAAVDRQKRLPAALRHPQVPRPPAKAPEHAPEPRRRWRGKREQPEAVRTSVISAPEWARMSPGARRLYGLEEAPGARRAG
jgi:hypothetical protein